MRRCLQQQRRTLGYCNNLSSRFFVTDSTQASWHHAVEQKNASVNALVHIVPEDEAGPVSEGPLNGMTVAVKDNICTKNMPTTCSSAMLRGNVRSPRSSQSRARDTNSAIHMHGGTTRLSITFRRDSRKSIIRLRRNDRRKDKLRRIRHGVRSPRFSPHHLRA